MVTFYSHIIQYVGAHIPGILILVILQICNNDLYLLWSRYLSHTRPFLDTDPKPPACHMIMSRQMFTSFISNVTRHPSWPRPISHISARLSSYATFMVKNLTQAYIMALPPSSGHLEHPFDLHLCHSLPYSLYNHFRPAKKP